MAGVSKPGVSPPLGNEVRFSLPVLRAEQGATAPAEAGVLGVSSEFAGELDYGWKLIAHECGKAAKSTEGSMDCVYYQEERKEEKGYSDSNLKKGVGG